MVFGLRCRISSTSTIVPTTIFSAILLSTTATSSSYSRLIGIHSTRAISNTAAAAAFTFVPTSSYPSFHHTSTSSPSSPSLIALNMLSTSSTSSSGGTIYKRTKLSHLPSSTKLIGTHSGTFQADEALGVWLLRQTPTYRHAKVVRSRDEAVLNNCDIVLDVGGIYDHSKLRYDHHQRGYDEKFVPKKGTKERCTKLSASGLIYRHYGKDVICEYYPQLLLKDTNNAEALDWVYTKMYDSFMEAIDAIDTGVEPLPPNVMGSDGQEVQLIYRDNTGLSSRVSRINPRWNEVVEDEGEDGETTGGTPPDPDARFEIASEMCGQDFMSILTKIVESDLPARTIVQSAVQSRYEVDSSGEIICLPSGGLPWKNEIYELEKEYGLDGSSSSTPLIKYVLYTDQSNMWRIQCVSVEGKAFENRRGLPEAWRGLRDEELSSLSGIEGCTFVHASGFIGGNASYEGVLEMARKALK
ncbi:hypothetical protein ACHAXH_007518 [Discostella pseudostelligera]